MIIRILAEGQWNVDEEHLTELNRLDAEVETAVDKSDETTYSNALAALLNGVRKAGTPLPVDVLHDSDMILPPADATLEEVRDLLNEDGLIPG